MKKLFLLLMISLFSVYGYSQTLDKTNKRYEAFLAEQKQNLDLKLIHLTFEILNTFTASEKEIIESFYRKESTIYIEISNDKDKIDVYFKSNAQEDFIYHLFDSFNIITNTIKKEVL